VYRYTSHQEAAPNYGIDPQQSAPNHGFGHQQGTPNYGFAPQQPASSYGHGYQQAYPNYGYGQHQSAPSYGVGQQQQTSNYYGYETNTNPGRAPPAATDFRTASFTTPECPPDYNFQVFGFNFYFNSDFEERPYLGLLRADVDGAREEIDSIRMNVMHSLRLPQVPVIKTRIDQLHAQREVWEKVLHNREQWLAGHQRRGDEARLEEWSKGYENIKTTKAPSPQNPRKRTAAAPSPPDTKKRTATVPSPPGVGKATATEPSPAEVRRLRKEQLRRDADQRLQQWLEERIQNEQKRKNEEAQQNEERQKKEEARKKAQKAVRRLMKDGKVEVIEVLDCDDEHMTDVKDEELASAFVDIKREIT
jgi:hypothetical protein